MTESYHCMCQLGRVQPTMDMLCSMSWQVLTGRLLRTGEKDADGVYINTEDIDCEVCKGDLHLWAVVSPTCPEKATCPEHVSALECPTETMRLLYRYPLNSEAVPDLLQRFSGRRVCQAA